MSINKVILIGNVGNDPIIKEFESHDGNKQKVVNFSLATTERGYTNKSGVTIEDKTEWHNISIWGGLVSVVDKFVNKGSKLYLEGKLNTRSWEDNSGKKYMTEIIVNNLELLGNKQNNLN